MGLLTLPFTFPPIILQILAICGFSLTLSFGGSPKITQNSLIPILALPQDPPKTLPFILVITDNNHQGIDICLFLVTLDFLMHPVSHLLRGWSCHF